ncbi:MAG TPA: EAL domain-containing protein [Myxococcales bacterium]|nr:EAL domain-containing protein [Myxococcales bacterium]
MQPAQKPNPEALPRLLLIDDDEVLRRTLVRYFAPTFDITAVPSAEAAIEALPKGAFDVVLSDVHLQGMSGVEFLKRLREHDLDLPVILMSGEPGLEAAISAVEYGAMRYMLKPFDLGELRNALVRAVSIRRLAVARRESLELIGHDAQAAGDRAGLIALVENAIRSLRVAWQPVVSWSRRRVVAWEALMRSKITNPDALIDSALTVGRIVELGRAMRDAVAAAGELAPPGDLHVNLHPQELLDDALYDSSTRLSRLASRVVLEITERSSLEKIPAVRDRVARLRKLGFRLALDDMGAGYAGLASFALLEPDAVKLDIALVRDVHKSPTRRRLISSLLAACKDLKCACVAEGVELPAERDTLADIGCDLFQGYLFARPDFAFPDAKF